MRRGNSSTSCFQLLRARPQASNGRGSDGRAARFGGLACLVALMLAGCPRAPAPLAAVTGKVSYENVPIAGGTIVFTPDLSRGHRGAIAVGEIKPDGTYSLRTGSAFGAEPGWYRVTVTCPASTSYTAPGEHFSVPLSMVPEKYGDPELSRLSCEVKENRANTIDFNLD